MSRIIIYSPSYDPTSGGIIVLHRLCHILLELGYDAALYPMHPGDFYVNSHYKSIVTRDASEDDITIYPEIVWGNPLNSKRVVRYIMNVGHVTLNRKDTWDDSDFWIYFSERFYDGLRDKNILHIIDSKIAYYKDYNVQRDYESCHTFRKNDEARLNNSAHIHPPSSIEIGFNWSDERLIATFNRCKKFYSYDTETYLSALAAICGCESVIVPTDNLTKEELTKAIPVCAFGIKYGEDDELARGELDKLRSRLDELDKEPYQIIPKIIQKIYEHFDKTDFAN